MGNNDVVLIVDDDKDCREVLGTALQLFHIPFISAGSGFEGIDLAIKYQPRLILMNLSMPGMSGLEATRIICTHPKSWWIPIVAVSASDPHVYRSKAIESGCVEWLQKPWGLDELMRLLERHRMVGKSQAAAAARAAFRDFG